MKQYLQILLLAFGLVAISYVTERLHLFPHGAILGFFTFLLEATASVCVLKKNKSNNFSKWQSLTLSLFILFLSLGDFFYIYFYYICSVGYPTTLTTILTSFLYVICLIGLSSFFVISIRAQFWKFLLQPITLLPIIALSPVTAWLAIRIVSNPLKNSIFKIVEITSLTGTYIIFILAFTIFLSSRERYWSQISAGTIIFTLSSWAIKFDKVMGYKIQFLDYAFLWEFGVILCCLTLIMNKPQNKQIPPYDWRSIPLNGRLVSLLLSFITIALIIASQKEIELLRLVTVSGTLSIIGSALLAQMHFDQLSIFDQSVLTVINSLKTKDSNQILRLPLPTELQSSYSAIVSTTILKMEELEELKRAQSLSHLASQVAHDVKSPLVALDSVAASVNALPEDDRILIRIAVNRIKDIANNLLDKNREFYAAQKDGMRSETGLISATAASTNEEPSIQLLSSLVDPLITEKRIQFRSHIGIEIDGQLNASSYGLFAKIQPTEFKRALSNLINNAVEALGEKGHVNIILTRKGNQIEIRVTDDGKGIPPEILAKLGHRGETYGKKGGSGLGLYHVRTSVESWGGKFKIESEVGKGTSIILSLSPAPAPTWFVPELKLAPNHCIVILDDDSSIHGIWQNRFDSLNVAENGIQILHFSTPHELTEWVNSSPDSQTALYLADHELIGFKETGLTLIESLNLGSQSILVTSRFEEKQIREGCEKLNVRLIPKGMAGFVPISFGQSLEKPGYVSRSSTYLEKSTLNIS